jgi:hypothetical protein
MPGRAADVGDRMHYDIHLIFIMIAVGLIFRKIGWKGWFAIAMLIIFWMALNLWNGLYM